MRSRERLAFSMLKTTFKLCRFKKIETYLCHYSTSHYSTWIKKNVYNKWNTLQNSFRTDSEHFDIVISKYYLLIHFHLFQIILILVKNISRIVEVLVVEKKIEFLGYVV